jgi:glutamyl-tRNA synthetase
MDKIVTRFAPSPTGMMHLGSARAALLPFLFSRHNNGSFFLRIDDTDKQRTKKNYIDEIFNDLSWLNINYDYIFYQSERNERYDHHFNILLKRGIIYPCYDLPEEIESVREIKRYSKKAPIYCFNDRKRLEGDKPHWRFKLHDNPNQMDDLIFGSLKFNKEWSDPVVRREDGSYCYVFCSVIDDIEHGVTHIIRGAEHIPNGIVQQQIGDAISGKWEVSWAHFPMLLSEKGEKLSKRNESLSLQTMRESGIESWTLISFLMEVGSSNKKIIDCNIDPYIKNFDLHKFSKVPKKFFEKELLERNKLIFRCLSEEVVLERIQDMNAWNLLKYNCRNWPEFITMYGRLIEFKKSGKSPGVGKQFYRDIFQMENGPPVNEVMCYLET